MALYNSFGQHESLDSDLFSPLQSQTMKKDSSEEFTLDKSHFFYPIIHKPIQRKSGSILAGIESAQLLGTIVSNDSEPSLAFIKNPRTGNSDLVKLEDTFLDYSVVDIQQHLITLDKNGQKKQLYIDGFNPEPLNSDSSIPMGENQMDSPSPALAPDHGENKNHQTTNASPTLDLNSSTLSESNVKNAPRNSAIQSSKNKYSRKLKKLKKTDPERYQRLINKKKIEAQAE